MRNKNAPIDYSDIPEITDFSSVRKNPYAEKIRKYGYTIRIHFSPEDVAQQTRQTIQGINRIEDLDWLDLDPDEVAALKKYRESNA